MRGLDPWRRLSLRACLLCRSRWLASRSAAVSGSAESRVAKTSRSRPGAALWALSPLCARLCRARCSPRSAAAGPRRSRVPPPRPCNGRSPPGPERIGRPPLPPPVRSRCSSPRLVPRVRPSCSHRAGASRLPCPPSSGQLRVRLAATHRAPPCTSCASASLPRARPRPLPRPHRSHRWPGKRSTASCRSVPALPRLRGPPRRDSEAGARRRRAAPPRRTPRRRRRSGKSGESWRGCASSRRCCPLPTLPPRRSRFSSKRGVSLSPSR
mmetsp:Transcript_2399/g.8326  ORF Transcript_2399/g.8326 Transcript_2399/m.8326 type:complete len:268 (-) Transcript_2399:134-937(-)